jgi:hypothetical protein
VLLFCVILTSLRFSNSFTVFVFIVKMLLLQTGEMEVKNPLFQDDPTPATPAVTPAPAAASGVVSDQVSVSSADSKK